MADCIISGEILDANNLLAPGVLVWCVKVVGPDLITTTEQMLVATSDEDGLVSFTLPQGSTASLSGAFYINGVTFAVNEGVALSIPAAATADLIDLVAAATFPTQGAVVQDDSVALPLLIGTFNFGAGIAAVPGASGVANITADIASTEAVQDALSTFFPDAAPYDWTYNDAGNAVGLVIAPATTSVNGLLSAADKTTFDALGATYAPIVHAHTFASLTSKPTTLAGYGITDAALLASSISDGDLTHAPDGNSVFDALGLKAPLLSPSFTTPVLGVAAAISLTGGLGSASAPSLNFIGHLDTGIYYSSSGGISISHLSNELLRLYGGSSSVLWLPKDAARVSLGVAQDLHLDRAGAANLRLGIVPAAAPIPQTISNQNVAAGTSNTAGADFNFDMSQSTGNVGGGSFNVRVSPAGNSGTAVNALATALTINSTKAATFAASVFASNTFYSGTGSLGHFGTGILGLPNTGTIEFSATSNATAAEDTIIYRASPGVVGIGTTAANALGKVNCAEYQIAGTKVIGARGAALTAADAGTINSGDAATDTIIANIRTRQGEMEARLGSVSGHGLFT